MRWHSLPDTGFEIRALAVWGRARYLSVTEAPHNTDFHTWMGKKHFCFFQTAETGNRTPNSGVKVSGANHYPRTPAPPHSERLASVSEMMVFPQDRQTVKGFGWGTAKKSSQILSDGPRGSGGRDSGCPQLGLDYQSRLFLFLAQLVNAQHKIWKTYAILGYGHVHIKNKKTDFFYNFSLIVSSNPYSAGIVDL